MIRSTVTLIALTTVGACGGAEAAQENSVEGTPSAQEQPAVSASATAPQETAAAMVYKTEGCGCCNGWVEHLQAAGFQVDARNVRDLMSVKADAGVPAELSSCHTALIDGYVVEGHVPAYVVRKLLEERPEVTGITVPGMPVGSPGMEGPNPKPYQVLAFDRQGNRTVFAEVDPR
jgi:hypothetical protein